MPEHMRTCGLPIDPQQRRTSFFACTEVRGESAEVESSTPVHVREEEGLPGEEEEGERRSFVHRVPIAIVRFGRARTAGGR